MPFLSALVPIASLCREMYSARKCSVRFKGRSNHVFIEVIEEIVQFGQRIVDGV